MDFKNKKIAIFGVTGSGKTFFARRLLRFYRSPVIYTVHKEDFIGAEDRGHLYVPPKENVLTDLDLVIERTMQLAKEGKVDALFIDEADMFFQSNMSMSPAFSDLNINHRHYGLALILISRRPQDMATRYVESCHYTFIFKLEGANAIQRFKEIDPRIVPLLSQVTYQKHNFVVKEIGEPSYLNDPLT